MFTRKNHKSTDSKVTGIVHGKYYKEVDSEEFQKILESTIGLDQLLIACAGYVPESFNDMMWMKTDGVICIVDIDEGIIIKYNAKRSKPDKYPAVVCNTDDLDVIRATIFKLKKNIDAWFKAVPDVEEYMRY